MSVNKCFFIGRLGKDPEVKFMPDGKAVVNFSLACSERYKDKQGNNAEKTEWVNCVCFGSRAEVIAKYVKKGNNFFVIGKLSIRKWTDKQGVERYSTEIVVDDFDFVEKSNSDFKNPESQPSEAPNNVDFDDDLMF